MKTRTYAVAEKVPADIENAQDRARAIINKIDEAS